MARNLRILEREQDLFSDIIGSESYQMLHDYTQKEQHSILGEMFNRGGYAIQELSDTSALPPSKQPYIVSVGLRERDKKDGMLQYEGNRKRIYLSKEAHENEGLRVEVYVHEHVHDVLRKYRKEHDERDVHALTLKILDHYRKHGDNDEIRNQAEAGYQTAMSHRIAHILSPTGTGEYYSAAHGHDGHGNGGGGGNLRNEALSIFMEPFKWAAGFGDKFLGNYLGETPFTPAVNYVERVGKYGISLSDFVIDTIKKSATYEPIKGDGHGGHDDHGHEEKKAA